MSFFISFISMLGVMLSIPMNIYIISCSVILMALLWLMAGVILISSVSSNKKSTLLWFFFFFVLFYVFLANTLIWFYVLFEFSLIPILLMIIYWGNQPERLSAGLYFLIYTSMVSIPFMIFVLSFVNISFYSFNISELSMSLMLVFLIPFMVKMPVFGLHFWLPKAHVEASTSGSMALAGILLKLGGYGISRVMMLFNTVIIKLSVLWMILSVLASMLTFMQSDTKKLVAYSSVTHMTFLMLGLSNINKSIMMILILLSLAHGWASMSMFMGAGVFSHASSSRLSLLMMTENKFHWMTLMMGALLVSNASLPPFPSFYSELFIISSLSYISYSVFFFIFLSLMVCYYNTYFFMLLSHNKSVESKLGGFSYSEFSKLSIMICWTILTIFWLLILS